MELTGIYDVRNPLPRVVGVLDGREVRSHQDIEELTQIISARDDPNPYNDELDRTLVTEPYGELATRIRTRLSLPDDAPIRLVEFVHTHCYSDYTSEDEGSLWVEARGKVYQVGHPGTTWPPSVVKLMAWLDDAAEA